MLDDLQYKVWDLQEALNLPVMDVCPHCSNQGYVSVSVPMNHAAFGRGFICICRKASILEKRMESSKLQLGLPEKRKLCNFDWFDNQPADMIEGKQEARQIAGLMAAGEPLVWDGTKKPGLCLVGDVGRGKSGLAASIVQYRLLAGDKCLWVDANEFMDNVYRALQKQFDRDKKRNYGQTEESDEFDNVFAFVESVSKVPFLVIDDLGDMSREASLTDYQRDKFYSVIRARYESMLPTVITTNLTIPQLYKQFGDRIADRIGEGWHWIRLSGLSFRFGK